MAGDKSQKPKIIEILSSSSSEDDDTEAISSSTSCDDDDYDESDWHSENERDDEDDELDEDDDESMCFCSIYRRLRDGNGEAFYPRSSFTIDCAGDVCKGDVVLFNQKVYQTFDKMKRWGHLLGRTVAGRIIKESYGEARQQHTFTVEVLWSRGTKMLASLFPLLVKGRNLYKSKTFRQRWKNEKERLEVLAEKHERGAVYKS